MRIALWVVAILLAVVGVFYAFNAYIQQQERGFAEATDVPIALASVALAILVAWRAVTLRR